MMKELSVAGRVLIASWALVLSFGLAGESGEHPLQSEPAPEPGAIDFLIDRYGLTVDEAVAELHFQHQVECLLPAAVTLLGEGYAGAVIGHSPASLTIHGTGSSSSLDHPIGQALDDCGLSTDDVEYSPSTFSLAELTALWNRLEAELVASGLEPTGAIGIDKLEITVDESLTKATGIVNDFFSTENVDLEWSIRVDVIEDLVVWGVGGRLLDGNGGYCTYGFSATLSSMTGWVTAGHCDVGSPFYFLNGSSSPISCTQSVTHYLKNSDAVDVMFVNDGDDCVNHTNEVKYGAGGTQRRSITSYSSTNPEDAVVCSYFGHGDKYSCGLIENNVYDPGAGYDANFALVDFTQSLIGGDSGSPVYLNSVAYGIIKGRLASAHDWGIYTKWVKIADQTPIDLQTS